MSKEAYDLLKKEIEDLKSRKDQLQTKVQSQTRSAKSTRIQLQDRLDASDRTATALKVSTIVLAIALIVMVVMYFRERKKNRTSKSEIPELVSHPRVSNPHVQISKGSEGSVPINAHDLPPPPLYTVSGITPTASSTAFHGTALSSEKKASLNK